MRKVLDVPPLLPIGLVIDCIGSYGRGVLRGIMAYAKANPGWAILLANNVFEKEADISDWQVRGLIVQSFSEAYERRMLAMGVPLSNVSNSVPNPCFPTVVPDDAAVGRLAAEHLLQKGFRELGFWGQTNQGFAQLRREAFHAAVAEAGARFHLCGPGDDLEPWLAALPKPVAVLGANDNWAHQVLSACRRLGLRVPDQVAVLGVDDDELFNAIGTPSLSSIRLPTEQIGYEAAALLERLMMEGEAAPTTPLRMAPLGVVTRQSTDVMALEDADVAAAMRFIHEYAHEAIQVEDVLEAVALSRRSLERRFRRSLGRSVLSEIARAHVERARQLLLTSDWPLHRIAAASGFANSARLGIVFRSVTGQSPSHYRRARRLPQTNRAEGAA